MYRYRTLWLAGMNTRPSHSVLNSPNGTIRLGDIVPGVEIWEAIEDGQNVKRGDRWMRLDSPIIKWVAIIHMGVVYGEILAEPQPEKIKLAYVKHDFNRLDFPNINYFPDVIQVQDRGNGKLLNRRIPVNKNWWQYIEKINDPKGYKYARSMNMMWINQKYDNSIPYSKAMAESIVCGGNFVQYTTETSTHLKLVTWANNYDTKRLDPLVHNWKNMPHRFWKACAVERNGTKVINVGNDVDMYIPIICNIPQWGLPAELWILKSKVEILGEEYWTFKDGNVYLGETLYKSTGAVPPKSGA